MLLDESTMGLSEVVKPEYHFMRGWLHKIFPKFKISCYGFWAPVSISWLWAVTRQLTETLIFSIFSSNSLQERGIRLFPKMSNYSLKCAGLWLQLVIKDQWFFELMLSKHTIAITLTWLYVDCACLLPTHEWPMWWQYNISSLLQESCRTLLPFSCLAK